MASPGREGAGHRGVRGQAAGRRRHRRRLDAARRRRLDARRFADAIIEEVIEPSIPAELRKKKVKYHINPTGRFVIGGPQGDAGLTGRKIIVDTYGGMGRHGGGAFSGKDPSKVDRSACYAARWVAKNIVAAKLARRCEVQLAYAIGVAEPVSVMVDTFGTSTVPEAAIMKAVRASSISRRAASSPRSILRKPIYSATSAYGHFGREPQKIGTRTLGDDAVHVGAYRSRGRARSAPCAEWR